MSKDLIELRDLYIIYEKAKTLNLEDFDYSSIHNKFVLKLKEYLQKNFEGFKLDTEETFAYFTAFYKGVRIEINHYDGIILSLEEEQDEEGIVDDLSSVFGFVFGPKIASYNYQNRDYKKGEEGHTSYFTTEWSMHPEERLYEIRNYPNPTPGLVKAGFNDLHTERVINELGNGLLTSKGYETLFGHPLCNDYKYKYLVSDLIKEKYPIIEQGMIDSWMNSCARVREMAKND